MESNTSLLNKLKNVCLQEISDHITDNGETKISNILINGYRENITLFKVGFDFRIKTDNGGLFDPNRLNTETICLISDMLNMMKS